MTDTAHPSDPVAPAMPQDQPVASQPDPQVGSMAKEAESAGLGSGLEISKDLTGIEMDLPKELIAAGVKSHPDVVPVSPSVAQMGVAPAGVNIPVPLITQTVALPLSDDQIAVGLSQSVESSWRWAAEWCIRRLKQLHIAFKKIGGKIVRVQEA